jgi:hypothetical protein
VKRVAALLLVALAGCASAPPPPGAQVAEDRLAQSVVPGRTTKAELLAAFGPTRSVRFDSGYEVWLYQSPAGGGRFAEFVVLVDPAGVVSKTRRRAPALP